MPETPSPILPAMLQQQLQALLPEALDLLRQMVNINSYTRNAAGVNRVGDLTAQLFESLGFSADRPQAIDCTMSARPPLGRHLFLTRQGTSGCRIGLIGHLDTVFTEGEEREHDFRWRESGGRIYGPGTVDMKGGNILIWMILAALREAQPALFDQVTWVVMFNAAEEGLDSDFGALARRRLGADALASLIFEGGPFLNEEHLLVVRRKGSARLRLRSRGRAAHAGVAHERGANAIVQMVHGLGHLADLTDYARDLTCNIGVIQGGVTPNRVPDAVEAVAELRAFDPAVLKNAIADAMRVDGMSTVASAADGFAARVEMCCPKYVPPWPHNPSSDGLLQLWQQTGDELGIKVASTSRGGLSDGNFIHDLVPTLDGLGPAGGNSHCAMRSADGRVDQEFVLPETFVPRALLTSLAIEQLVSGVSLRMP